MAQVEISATEAKLLRNLLMVEQVAQEERTLKNVKVRAQVLGLTMGDYEAMFQLLHAKLLAGQQEEKE